MLRCFTDCVCARLWRLEALTRFRPARHQETSTHPSGSRGTLAITPVEVYFRGATPHLHWRPEGSVGATRARKGGRRDARSTLRGMGGATLGSRVSARHVMAFQSRLLLSSPTAHFPSPAYGEARDGALATAPRGGNGGAFFSPFSVVVAVGPSRGRNENATSCAQANVGK